MNVDYCFRQMRSFLCMVILAALSCYATAKVYERCELATELIRVHGFPRRELGDCESTCTLNGLKDCDLTQRQS